MNKTQSIFSTCRLLCLICVMAVLPGVGVSRVHSADNNWLGLSFRLIISDAGMMPVSIASVRPDTIASKAGFKPGDIIYRVNDLPVQPTNFFSVLGSFPAGTTITFQVIRDNYLRPIQFIMPDRGGSPSEPPQAVKPEGTPQPGVTPVYITSKTNPVYPDEARKQGIEGKVTLKLHIGTKGQIKSVIVTDSPHPLISEAALRTVKQWKFQPAKKNGEPFATIFHIVINFRLK